MRICHVVAAIVAIGLVVSSTQAANLYAWDTFTYGDDVLATIDTSGPTAMQVGVDGSAYGVIAEIEFANGVIYGADTGDNTLLHSINPADGLPLGVLTMTFPTEGNVITSLEYVGNTLYGGLTSEGGAPTYLSTIDLGSGVVSVVGATGFGSPFGGLAYDGTTLYGVSAGGSSGELFTVDLVTGAATSVGAISVAGAGVGMTGLEFGDDGVLYGLPNINDALAGHLLSIDPATGLAMDLGDTGAPGLVAITTPEPASLSLLVLGGLLAIKRRH